MIKWIGRNLYHLVLVATLFFTYAMAGADQLAALMIALAGLGVWGTLRYVVSGVERVSRPFLDILADHPELNGFPLPDGSIPSANNVGPRAVPAMLVRRPADQADDLRQQVAAVNGPREVPIGKVAGA